MVHVHELQKALPASGLCPQVLAIIDGFSILPPEDEWKESIFFLEPPAGQRHPYVDAFRAMRQLLLHKGLTSEAAEAQANVQWRKLKAVLKPSECVFFYRDFDLDDVEYIPVTVFNQYLRQEGLASDHVIEFLEQALNTTMEASRFSVNDSLQIQWANATLPDEVLAKAMIEFVTRPPQDEGDDTPAKFDAWRQSMREVAERLKQALGESVYDFDVSCDPFDMEGHSVTDDSVHRFLVLHWVCSSWPESNYVKFLVARSGAQDVQELKTALLDPANYSQSFKMHDAFRGINAVACRMKYRPLQSRWRFSIVFSTALARTEAQWQLLQKIGCDALIIAPETLVSTEWIKRYTRHCRSWVIQYSDREAGCDPIGVLARSDELCVIADHDECKDQEVLAITDSTQVLLWLALERDIKARYCLTNGTGLYNPQVLLHRSGVPQRVSDEREQASRRACALKEIRLSCDFGSSGLWNAQNQMLSYDELDVPFHLIRRIAAWQLDYEETFNPPQMPTNAWWSQHEQQALDIARQLQAALGTNTSVKLYRKGGWLHVAEIND